MCSRTAVCVRHRDDLRAANRRMHKNTRKPSAVAGTAHTAHAICVNRCAALQTVTRFFFVRSRVCLLFSLRRECVCPHALFAPCTDKRPRAVFAGNLARTNRPPCDWRRPDYAQTKRRGVRELFHGRVELGRCHRHTHTPVQALYQQLETTQMHTRASALA